MYLKIRRNLHEINLNVDFRAETNYVESKVQVLNCLVNNLNFKFV